MNVTNSVDSESRDRQKNNYSALLLQNSNAPSIQDGAPADQSYQAVNSNTDLLDFFLDPSISVIKVEKQPPDSVLEAKPLSRKHQYLASKPPDRSDTTTGSENIFAISSEHPLTAHNNKFEKNIH